MNRPLLFKAISGALDKAQHLPCVALEWQDSPVLIVAATTIWSVPEAREIARALLNAAADAEQKAAAYAITSQVRGGLD